MTARIRPGSGVHVLVPIKRLSCAKSRLSPTMGDECRRRVVLAMLDDTLRALDASEAVEAVTVITPDAAAAAQAGKRGMRVLPEHAVDDTADRLNEVLAAAARTVRSAGGPAHLAVVQADLPALRTDEFGAAFRAALTAAGCSGADDDTAGARPARRPDGRAFVADRPGLGTTALFACGAETALHPRFGTGSAATHSASGATPLVGAWPGLRSDVDTLEDLAHAQRLGAGPATVAAWDALCA